MIVELPGSLYEREESRRTENRAVSCFDSGEVGAGTALRLGESKINVG